MALWHVRNFEKTIAAYQNAVAIFHAGGPRHREARVLTNLGNAQRGLGRFEEAIISHEDAAAIFRQTGDRHGLGDALTNLGVALRHASKFEEAITALQNAVAVFRETGDRHREGMALTNLGAALQAELPRVFRTGNLRLFHAASCPFRYSSRTSCGVRYPSVEWRRVLL